MSTQAQLVQRWRKFAAVIFAAAVIASCAADSGDSSGVEADSGSSPVGSAADVLPPTPTPTPPANEFAIVGQPEQFLLDDLSLVGLSDWINSDPLTLDQLASENRLVLLDFWTYTCVNCVRTFPYLKAWHDAYSEHGLTIIGVHSPEFEFEKDAANVQRAVERYEIDYPVALDSDKKTWDKYGNHFWPSKYLITVDPQGESAVVLRHFGEGGYENFEQAILGELDRLGRDVSHLRPISLDGPERSEMAHTITRELYGGYSKNYLSDGLYAGQDAYYEAPDRTTEYVDDGTRRRGQFYLDGGWKNGESAVVSDPVATDKDSSFRFDFWATSVNAVLAASEIEQTVFVELDGKPVSSDSAGQDLEISPDGRTFVRVNEPRLYQLIELPDFGNHELSLTTDSEGLSVYTITFGVSEFGP